MSAVLIQRLLEISIKLLLVFEPYRFHTALTRRSHIISVIVNENAFLRDQRVFFDQFCIDPRVRLDGIDVA